MRIAIIGGGVAGLAAGWRLAAVHDVTLYEAEPRLGGHALTLDIPRAADGDPGETWPIDIGFQLWHPKINPNLAATTRALGVKMRPMTFHIASERRVGDGPPTGWANTGRHPAGEHVEAELARFADALPTLSADPRAALGDVLRAHGFGAEFIRTCLVPLLSFWWVSRTGLLDVPASAVLPLMAARILSLSGPTTWYGIEGGSRTTCARLAAPLGDRIRLDTPVTRVERRPDRVVVHTANGAEAHDQVIFAVDGATALELLDAPSDAERALLGGVVMVPSTLWVHRDPQVMPTRRDAWCYGNYIERHLGADPTEEPQRLMTYAPPPPPGADPIFVTVGDDTPPVPAERVLFRRRWHHMVIDPTLFDRRFGPVQGRDRTWYCGGHTVGFPVHEHALLSGLIVADALGAAYPFADDAAARAGFARMRGRILAPDAPSAAEVDR